MKQYGPCLEIGYGTSFVWFPFKRQKTGTRIRLFQGQPTNLWLPKRFSGVLDFEPNSKGFIPIPEMGKHFFSRRSRHKGVATDFTHEDSFLCPFLSSATVSFQPPASSSYIFRPGLPIRAAEQRYCTSAVSSRCAVRDGSELGFEFAAWIASKLVVFFEVCWQRARLFFLIVMPYF